MPDKDKNGKKDPPDHSTGDVNGRDSAHPDQQQAEREEKQTQREESPETPVDTGGEESEAAPEADGTDETGPADPKDPDEPDAGASQSEKSKEDAIDKEGFPIVGIGASAGGLEALEAFVSALPEDSGIAFVAITHTHPDYKTRMPELLKRESKNPVVLLEDGMQLSPGTIYVPPADRDPIVENGVIRLLERASRPEMHLPIDRFLKSLAEDRGEAAGCVILSGTGTDGSEGLRRIKEHGGVAFAQTRNSARHAGMPASAIETGMIDYVLTPSEIPGQLIDYFRNPVTIPAKPAEKEAAPDALPRILSFLADRTKHDFSMYKKSTVTRRIQRRMTVTRCRTTENYLKFLHRDSKEIQALFQDLLIGVTNFFRDPEVFDYMLHEVLPDLLSRGENDQNFRVWIPGCSTGEEAYSVAIIVLEAMKAQGVERPIQIFATDIDATAIEKARQGLYPKNIAADVSSERLDRYFNQEENAYRIKNEIREPVVFAEQNVLRDPPFMHLDLLVCRNLLIYLEPKAQNKLLPLFHYNLKPGGILFLGTSESTGRFAELFEPVSKKFSIYKKRGVRSPVQHGIAFPVSRRRLQQRGPERGKWYGTEKDEIDIANALKNLLLKEHTPPCVLVKQNGEILYIHGRTGRYLEHAPGKPNLRITDMAREGLRHALSSALDQAMETNEEIREPGLQVKTNGDFTKLDLTVKPLQERLLKDLRLVLFNEVPEATVRAKEEPGEAARIETSDDAAARRIAALERELERLREDYRSSQEELETSNEELKSANEEMYSSNEELQSTNEELESSREELESLNEEISTVNSELQDKIAEAQEMYDSITNVLNNTGIAIVFLDNDLVVRRFTEEAARLINLIDKDVGRAFDHITHNLEFDNLKERVRRVLKMLTPFEDDVRTSDGHWYRMRIMVNRTDQNTIEGAVLTFIDINVQKKAQEEIKANSEQATSAAKRFAENIVDTVRESLLVLDSDGRVITANRSFYESFNTSAGQTKGRSLFELGNGQWDIPELHRLLDETLTREKAIEDYRVEHQFPEIGFRRMRLNARHLIEEKGEDRILLAIEDVTDRAE